MIVVQIAKVDPADVPSFRKMVEAYWQELMPESKVAQDFAQREAYFQSRFCLDDEGDGVYWAIAGDRRIGFLMFRVYEDGAFAHVHDFYVVPGERRKGYGTAMVEWLLEYLDRLGVTRIDLHVRVDNPGAMEFWKIQGFEIVQYRLRKYRESAENNENGV